MNVTGDSPEGSLAATPTVALYLDFIHGFTTPFADGENDSNLRSHNDIVAAEHSPG